MNKKIITTSVFLIFILLVICINAGEITPFQPEMVMLDGKTAVYTDPIFKDKSIEISTEKEVYRCLPGCNIRVEVNNTYISKDKIKNFKISYQDELGQIVYGTKFKEGYNETQFKELEYFRENDINEYMFPVEVPAGLGETKFDIVLENDGIKYILDPAITSGCTESNEVLECTGALTGNWIDTDNSSIYIHDAVIDATTGDYLRLNTTHGWINISNNVTINSYSANGADGSHEYDGGIAGDSNFRMASRGSSSIYLYANDSHNIIINGTIFNNYGGRGGHGFPTCTSRTSSGGYSYLYGGGHGGSPEFIIYSGSQATITNSTIDIHGGDGGNSAHWYTVDTIHGPTHQSPGGGYGGVGNFTSYILISIEETTIEYYGGEGGDGNNCECSGDGSGETCSRSLGGWGGDSLFFVNNTNANFSNVSFIGYSGKSGPTGTYGGGCAGDSEVSGNHGHGDSFFTLIGSKLNVLLGIIINANVTIGGGTNDLGRSSVYFESSEKLTFTNQTISADQPATNYHIINLTNETEDKLGVFDTDFKQTTYVYCLAPDIMVGNDTTLDTDLDFTNCSSYQDGNITWVDYDEFTGILENPWIEIGDIDGTREWSREGFTGPETINPTTDSINTYLASCTADSQGNCQVPFKFYSDTAGTLQISNISIDVEGILTNLNVSISNTNILHIDGKIDGNNITLDKLNDSLTETNLTLIANENQTIYLNIWKNSTVDTATISLKGLLNLSETYGMQDPEPGGTASFGGSEYVEECSNVSTTKGGAYKIKSYGYTDIPGANANEWNKTHARLRAGGSSPGGIIVNGSWTFLEYVIEYTPGEVFSAFYEMDADLQNAGDYYVCAYAGAENNATFLMKPNTNHLYYDTTYSTSFGRWSLPDDTWSPEYVDIDYDFSIDVHQYPYNLYLEVGTGDGTHEWNESGWFLTTNTTSDFSSAINTYLASCTADSQGNCQVPLLFHSDTVGKLTILDIDVNYTMSITTQDFASTISSYLNGCTLQSSGRCQIYLNVSSNKTGILQLSNVNLTYIGGKIINFPYGRAVFELNKSHKATELEASGVKEIYVGRDNTLLSGNYTGIVYINYSLDNDIDFENVSFNTSNTLNKSVMYGFNDSAIINVSLLIPYSGKGEVYICPNVTSLTEVNKSCTGVIGITNGSCKEGMCVDTKVIESNEYYVVDNITGTGGGENEAPNVTSPELSPFPLYASNNLTASVIYTDNDLDNGTVYFNWTVNGTQVNFINQTDVENGTQVNSTLDAGNYSGGETIAIYVWVYDGVTTSNTTSNSTTTIGCGYIDTDLILEDNFISTGTCFIINTSDLTLDCAGYTINYSTAGIVGYGINITGFDNTTIKNCIIEEGNTTTNSKFPIYFTNTDGGAIQNNTLTTSGNTSLAIYLSTSSNLTLTDNIINTIGASGDGIWLYGSSDSNTLTNNNITTSGTDGYGISIYNSSLNNITSNTITTTGNSGDGVYLHTSSDSTLTNNTINTNGTSGYGIWLYNSSTSNITDNNITTTGASGLAVYIHTSSDLNNITSNTITTTGASGHGIIVYISSHSNTLTNNNITTNGTDGYGTYVIDSNNTDVSSNNFYEGYSGIIVEASSFTNVSENFIDDNTAVGIYLTEADNTKVYNNTVTNNLEGIYVRDASVNNIIYDNTIKNNFHDGFFIYWDSTDNYFYNNTIESNNGGFFIMSRSNNNNFTQNTVNKNTYGFLLQDNSINNRIDKETINNNHRYGIKTDKSSTAIINNSEILNTEEYDIHMRRSSSLTLYNTKVGQLMNFSSSTFIAYNLTIKEPFGEINYFNETISITSDRDTINNLNISSNSIFLNSTNLPELNKTAELTFNSLAWGVATPLSDGAECSAGICTNKSYAAGILSYFVPYFTTYSSQEGDTTDPTFNTPTSSIPLDTEHNITFSVTITDANYDNTTFYITQCDVHFQNCSWVHYDVTDYTGSRVYSYTVDKSFFYSTKGLHGIPYEAFFTHEDLSGNVGTSLTIDIEVSYYCGNGICEEGESSFICSNDCGVVGVGQGTTEDVQPIKLIIPEYLTHFYPLEDLMKKAEILYHWLPYEELPLSLQKQKALEGCKNYCVSDQLYYGGQIIEGGICEYQTTECLACMSGQCVDSLKMCNDKCFSDWAYTDGYSKNDLCIYKTVKKCDIECIEIDLFENIVPFVECKLLSVGEKTEKASWCRSGYMAEGVCIKEKIISVNVVPKSLYLKGIINKTKIRTISILNTGDIDLVVGIEIDEEYQKYLKPVIQKEVKIGKQAILELEFLLPTETISFNMELVVMTDDKRQTQTISVTLEKGKEFLELGEICDFNSECRSNYCSDKGICEKYEPTKLEELLKWIKENKSLMIAILIAVIGLGTLWYLIDNKKKKPDY